MVLVHSEHLNHKIIVTLQSVGLDTSIKVKITEAPAGWALGTHAFLKPIVLPTGVL